MYHSFLIHSSADGHLGCFQILVIVNCAAMNIGVHITFLIGVSGFLGYIPKSGITGSNGSSIFNCLRKLHTVLHSGCTSLHSHQQCMRILFSLHLHQRSFFVYSLMIAILKGVRWCLIIVLIFISSMISDFEHVFICLLDFLLSSSEKYLFMTVAHFFDWVVYLPFVKLYEFPVNFGD